MNSLRTLDDSLQDISNTFTHIEIYIYIYLFWQILMKIIQFVSNPSRMTVCTFQNVCLIPFHSVCFDKHFRTANENISKIR